MDVNQLLYLDDEHLVLGRNEFNAHSVEYNAYHAADNRGHQENEGLGINLDKLASTRKPTRDQRHPLTVLQAKSISR